MMNIKLSKNLKIKLNDSGKGSGANFDYDFKIIVIDKTKKPYKNKIITRDDIIRINAPLNGRCVNKTIDDFIEWTFCYNSPLYIQYRNDPTKHWNIDKQQWDNVERQAMNQSQLLYKIWLSNNDSVSRQAIYKSFKRQSYKSNIGKKLKYIWKNINIHNTN